MLILIDFWFRIINPYLQAPEVVEMAHICEEKAQETKKTFSLEKNPPLVWFEEEKEASN